MAEKVLVVDDERQIRDLLGEFLEREGYEVLLSSAGEEAIELAERKIPHAILLDVKMPGIDGVETCRRLRADKQTRFIPVIMVTAFGTTKNECIEMGSDDLVNKPIDLTELIIRIKSVLRIGHITDPVERMLTYMDELEKNQQK